MLISRTRKIFLDKVSGIIHGLGVNQTPTRPEPEDGDGRKVGRSRKKDNVKRLDFDRTIINLDNVTHIVTAHPGAGVEIHFVGQEVLTILPGNKGSFS